MDTAIGYPIPTFGVAYRMAELLSTLHKLRPERRYALRAPVDRRVGNVDIHIFQNGEEFVIELPTKLYDGTWVLAPWQYLLREIDQVSALED